MLMGQVAKGITLLVGSFILVIFTLGLSSFITIPINIIDAVLIAKKKQQGRKIGEWKFF